LVREHQLKLTDIAGSGKDGRVLKEDVLAHLEQPSETVTSSPQALPSQGKEWVSRVEPLRGVRAVMAKRMVESASTIPHFHYGEEIDVTALLAMRERLKPLAEAKGERLTLMPFFMKAMALAITEEPIVNAQLNAAGDALHYFSQCNIGMAVDSKAGLMVPNVKSVERLTLLEIAREVSRLTTAAREGRVDQADLKGGTISISNIGALGGTYAAPIINAPEAAIVAIGKTQWLPRFDAQGEVQRRAIMTITWAGDHRFIDGGTIARFCNSWKGFLEDPETMLLHLG
jgi:2-oxoisovalerate dehydrogenase E2 component (dihydrolipoyl transacylase)